MCVLVQVLGGIRSRPSSFLACQHFSTFTAPLFLANLMNQMILFPIMIRQHMQNLSTSTTLENLLNLTNLFPITSKHIQILTNPTTLANLQNLKTCLPYISCHYMQVLPEPGNPFLH